MHLKEMRRRKKKDISQLQKKLRFWNNGHIQISLFQKRAIGYNWAVVGYDM